MTWQDILLTLVNVIIGYALIPQIFKNFKEKSDNVSLQTSILSGIGLYVVSWIYFTLNLILSAAIVLIIAILWTIITVQGFIYKSKK